jgi:PTH1 family peptidyl-tRNA hydrolase
MNISGVALASAWKTFVAQNQSHDGAVGLVVLHDELELPLGQVRVKSGNLSAKGHNGLKSIKEKMPNVEYTRIGIGIGRPLSREKDAVAAYVLGKMSAGQRAAVMGSAGRVEAEIRKLVGGM